MKKVFFAILFASILRPFCCAQEDPTEIGWDKVLYEVFTTKQDSMTYQYKTYKEPFFEAYFHGFSSEELDSLTKKCQHVIANIVLDSLKYPEYFSKVEYYWNVSDMKLFISLNKARRRMESEAEEWRRNGGKVKIEYVQYGKKEILDNNFSIFFVLFDSVQKTVIKPNIVQDTFIVSKELIDKEAYVIFKYKNKMFYRYCPNIRNMGNRWTFHFDKKPYRTKYFNPCEYGINRIE